MSATTTQPIALDPALGLDPITLAAAWNSNPATAAHGTLQLTDTPTKGFDLAATGLVFVGGLATGLLTNYIYDLIKGTFAERDQAPPFTVQQIDQPDGTKIIVVIKA
ncbi:MAG: hypothetical protein KDE19_00125 [Caldilineaceae bacterium]|nr:hypothetical protein [Caldilineaceae bacterium]